MKLKSIVGLCLLVVAIFMSTRVTFFVIPPVGLMTDGQTRLMWRLEGMSLIDSARGYCVRNAMNNIPDIACQGVTLATVMARSETIAELPYSSILERIAE